MYPKRAPAASIKVILGIGCAVGGALPSPARAQAPLTAQAPSRAARAAADLRRALEALAQQPRRADLVRALQRVQSLEQILHSYFHAPNLAAPEARGPALTLRPWIAAELFGDEGLWQLGADDVIRLRPEIRDRLCVAALALGRCAEARRQVQAALAAGGETPARAAWLRAATGATGAGGSGVEGAALKVDQKP